MSLPLLSPDDGHKSRLHQDLLKQKDLLFPRLAQGDTRTRIKGNEVYRALVRMQSWPRDHTAVPLLNDKDAAEERHQGHNR